MPDIKHKKAWVLTPNQDYTPTGVLQLGQILTDYADPNSAVLTEGTVPISAKTLKDQSIHRGVDYTSAELYQAGFRAWLKATVHGLLPVGGALRADLLKAHWERFSGHTLSVFQFSPSVAYAKDALAHGDAPTQIKVPWYKTHARVWLVTGLRVLGKGAKVDERFIKRVDAAATAEGDGTVSGAAPVAGGAGGHAGQAAMGHRSILDADPFVYAYRLHEIIVKRKLIMSELKPFAGGEISSVSQGDDYDDNEDGVEDKMDGPQFIGYEVVAVDNEAFDGDEDDGDDINSLFVE